MPAAGALIAAAVAGTGVWWVTRPSVGPVTRMALALDGEAALFVDPQSSDVAISPDGRQVVYKGGSRGDRTRLFVRGLDRLEPVALTEPGLPKSPFLSPNGEWVGYFEPGTSLALKKVAIGGGPSQVLAYLHGPSRGASWGTDGTIVASTATALKSFGLTRVAETGGDAQVLTTPDTGRGEGDHLWPHHLPDGKSLLFTVSTVTGSRDASVVELLDLVTGERRPILRGASQARYLRSGHLVYVAGDSLWAVAFDLNRRETSGPARVVAPHVLILPTGTAEFDIADDGTLVYVADTAALTRRRLVWVDRNGGEEEIAEAPPRFYAEPRLSPDGMRIAVAADDDERDIWSWDISRRVLSRVTTGPAIDQSPLWSADGRRLFFLSTRGGGAGSLFSQAADGGGVAERVTDSRIVREPSGMLADGRVLYTENDDIMSVTADPPRRVLPVVRTPALERKGTVSPDGRWIAFESLDAGAVQVFVRPFPNVEDARVQISTDGGLQPRWSRDGRELFFLAIDGTLMGVHVERGTSWSAGYPAPIVPRNVFADVSMSLRAFDVAPDGQRFIVVKGAPGSAVPAPRIIVVQNWLAEIARGSRQ